MSWRPGATVHVTGGGRDVQSVLDSDGLELGVVNWHAAWIDACEGIAPFMSRYSLASIL